MKAILTKESLPKFLNISKSLPEFMVKYMDLKRGELAKVAPADEQKWDLKNYVKIYVKRGGDWKYKVLGWKHLDKMYKK